MAISFVLTNINSQGVLMSRALVRPGLFKMGDSGTPYPKLKLVSVKKSVSVKFGKFIKIDIGIGNWHVIPTGGKNRYRYVIYFAESASVSVWLKISKSVRIEFVSLKISLR